YRCRSCLVSELMCAPCLLAAHSRRPLHDIEKWEGSFFSVCELRDVGLLVNLGHGRQVCPQPRDAACWRVVTDSGIHHVNLVFCGCDMSRGVDAELSVMGWMRLLDPQTCGTARILKLHLKYLAN
ncbi:hypothetical protein B0H11DRAFT_1736887, partial [Mycena galericulata]